MQQGVRDVAGVLRTTLNTFPAENAILIHRNTPIFDCCTTQGSHLPGFDSCTRGDAHKGSSHEGL